MMDRNLGATSATPGDVGALGLLYQWGRKDPFMGSCDTSRGTLAAATGEWVDNFTELNMSKAEENPTTYAYYWYGTTTSGRFGWCPSTSNKGLYDPCPVGYRVPDGGEDSFWTKAKVSVTADATNCGLYWSLADGTKAWYPTTGVRYCNRGIVTEVGYRGFCWSATKNDGGRTASNLLYYCDELQSEENLSNMNGSYREDGHSVRCVKE
jgi:hypothetical protein